MDLSPLPRRPRLSTFGEALIVVSVIAGFFYVFAQDKLSPENIWSYISFLAVIVVFYFALLFCRMLFFWMTGGDAASYPWWAHQGETWQSQVREKTKK